MNYLNTDSSMIKFNETIHDFIYVDKSLLIEKVSLSINKPMTKYICITRRRRFGKTINANMLAAYYTKGFDSHYLFDQLKIAKTSDYEKYMNKYNVIYIDFSRIPDDCNQYDSYMKIIKNNLIESIETNYPIVIKENEPIY